MAARSRTVQDEVGSIAQALGLAGLFCRGVRCVVILGDNIFQESLVVPMLTDANKHPDHAWVALKKVHYPSRYAVPEFRYNRIVNIEEKPDKPKSDYAVAGIYIYPPDVFTVVPALKPSRRGELEITDVNQHSLKEGRLGFSHLYDY